MRILTWNTQGSISDMKADELKKILDYWAATNPIGIACFQELAVSGDTLKGLLEGRGYQCFKYREGWRDGGRAQMIALNSKFGVTGHGKLTQLNLSKDEKALDVRIPMYCEVSFSGAKGIVYNYHAESPGSLIRSSMLKKVSDFVAGQAKGYAFSIFAGDLNTFDAREIGGVFSGFAGVNHRYDFIMAQGVRIKDGISSDASKSDHVPVSASME